MIEALQDALAIETAKSAVMWLVLFAAVLMVAWSLRSRSRLGSSRIDLDDLLLDDAGRLDPSRCVFAAAFLFSVWMMTYLTTNGQITEGYFTAFNLTWAAPVVAKVIWGKPMLPKPEGDK